MKTVMKTLLRMSGVLLMLAAGSSAAASGVPPGGAIERFGNGRSQDDEIALPEDGRDAVVCRYRSAARNCVRPVLTDPSDCLIVKSPKAGAPIRRRNRVW